MKLCHIVKHGIIAHKVQSNIQSNSTRNQRTSDAGNEIEKQRCVGNDLPTTTHGCKHQLRGAISTSTFRHWDSSTIFILFLYLLIGFSKRYKFIHQGKWK